MKCRNRNHRNYRSLFKPETMTTRQLNRLADIKVMCLLGTDQFTHEEVTKELEWLIKMLIEHLDYSSLYAFNDAYLKKRKAIR